MEQMNLQISQILQPTLNVQIVQNNAPVVEAKIVIGGGGTVSVVFGDTMTGTGTPSDPVNVSNYILEQIQNNSETAEENASQITEIQRVIPATANPQNQLADQGFVNSSIQTATAYFRGDWATWADVPNDPALYPADATGNHTPITNDYMVVIADELENGGTWRYKYTGSWTEQGKSGWLAEYQVNETPLTAAQLAALNSGVTAEDVASFVKKTDYAGTYKAGLVACSQEAAVTTNAFGYLQTLSKNLASYKEASSIMFVGKGTLENIKDDYVKRGITANTIALTDEEKAAAQAWLGVESGGGDYLPLSGGRMTGAIQFGPQTAWGSVITPFTQKGNQGLIKFSSYTSKDQEYGVAFDGQTMVGFRPLSNNGGQLGHSNYKWSNVYTTKLNNGADLIVPTEGGTLARLEDLEGLGGASLPDQTGNAGKFLTTDGTDVSWSDKPLINNGVELNSLAVGERSSAWISATAIGKLAKASSTGGISVGYTAESSRFATAIGVGAIASANNAIQIGSTSSQNEGHTNSDANTFKVGNANGNFEMMDANGNVPLGRLTYVTDQIGDISTALTAILGE